MSHITELGPIREALTERTAYRPSQWMAVALAVASFVLMFVVSPAFVIPFLFFVAYAARAPKKIETDIKVMIPESRPSSPLPSTQRTSNASTKSA